MLCTPSQSIYKKHGIGFTSSRGPNLGKTSSSYFPYYHLAQITKLGTLYPRSVVFSANNVIEAVETMEEGGDELWEAGGELDPC